jgi:hypothetical protein
MRSCRSRRMDAGNVSEAEAELLKLEDDLKGKLLEVRG